MSSRSATVRGLLTASHAGPTAAVTVFAAVLAVAVGAGPGTVLLVSSAVLAGQLSVGWCNDWIDAGRDLAVGRADKPVVAGLVSAELLRRAAVLAVAACVVLSMATGWVAGLTHLAAVASAWAYNLGLKSTAASWLPYAVSFGLLSVFVVLAVPGDSAPAGWVVAAAALLGVGAHLANALPDLEDDEATGVSGLPHRLGRARAGLLAPVVLAAAVATVVLGPRGTPRPVAWAAAALAVVLAGAAGAVALTRPRSRAPFALSIAVAAVCVALLVVMAADPTG